MRADALWHGAAFAASVALSCYCTIGAALPHPQENPVRMLQRGGQTHYFRILDYAPNLSSAARNQSKFATFNVAEFFWLADRDGDGELSLRDWQSQYERFADPAEASSEDAFAANDANGDGVITKEEFPTPLKRRYLPYHAFFVDLDDDGFVSEDECNAVLEWPSGELSQEFMDTGPGCKLADTDGDGRVSTTEYSVCCGYPKRHLHWSEAKQFQLRVPPPEGVERAPPPMAAAAEALARLDNEAIAAFLETKGKSTSNQAAVAADLPPPPQAAGASAAGSQQEEEEAAASG